MPRLRGRSNASTSFTLNIDPDDPISRALQPPTDESPVARDERIRAEREAKRVSDEIDDELKKEKALLKKKKPVRVLLLGQSESGKSTTLKNFQIHYAPQSWREERAAWRAVIQLNLIRSVVLVLDTISDDHAIVAQYAPLVSRLAVAERILHRRLSPGDSASPESEPGDYRSFSASSSTPPFSVSSPREFFVRSSGTPSWKNRFLRRLSGAASSSQPSTPLDLKDDLPSPTAILHESLPEMKALWQDRDVRRALLKADRGTSAELDEDGDQRIPLAVGATDDPQNNIDIDPSKWVHTRVEDVPGFFLPHADRVARPDYEPSDDDIIHARLRTMGVQEHKFIFERGLDTGREWRVYDVGGARSQRALWLSFFDEMDAIIFLAPISCFDETLAEDKRINRLEDSITLWRSLCRSPLLAQVQLVLFLNKVDILRRKLAHGARVARHVTSFGNRSNDVETVAKYFKTKFKEILRQYSPEPRPYYVYLTSVTDTKATGTTLSIVREGILRSNLRDADFL